MFFLRTFVFSFAILWRYALVFPILLVAMALFGLVAVIFSILLGLLAPFLGLILVIAFGVATGIIPVMVGLRVGLQSHHIMPRNSYAGLMAPAIGYGFLEALVTLILLMGTIGAFVMATNIAFADLLAIEGYEDWMLLVDVISENRSFIIAALAIGGGLLICLRTALLVPLTGAAIGADPDGRSHTPFYGFGDGFWSLLPLTVISQIGIVLSVPFVIWLAGPLGIVDSIAETAVELEEDAFIEAVEMIAAREASGIESSGVEVASISTIDAIKAYSLDAALLSAMMFGCFLYFFSLQCAGAVLVQLRNYRQVSVQMRKRDKEVAKQLTYKPAVQHTDMMELMRSRMPARKY